MNQAVQEKAINRERLVLAIAAFLAMLTHGLLATLTQFNLSSELPPAAEKELSVTLAPLLEPIPAERPLQTDPSLEPFPIREVDPKLDQIEEIEEPIEATDPPVAETPVITSRLLNDFIERETDSHLEQQSQQLDDFAQSFEEYIPQRRATQEVTTNIYGEIEVRTRIGDRDVCYLQNNQFSADDWGFNLVMFYACGEGANDKPSFSLE